MKLPELALVGLAAAWCSYLALHSLLAATTVKRAAAARVPWLHARYRLVYNAVALLLLLPPVALTIALRGEPLWRPTGAARWVADGAAVLALVGVALVGRGYDLREFLGLASPGRGAGAQGPGSPAGRGESSPQPLRISTAHRYVRHPWYSLGLLVLWTRPMDSALLVAVVCVTVYVWVGSWLEERKLLVEFGEAYRRYRRRVPGLVPRPWRRLGAGEAARLERLARDSGRLDG